VHRHTVLRRVSVAILRAGLWSALAGALITVALFLRTSPELRPGFLVATWLGLSCALAFVPSLVMELGVVHLVLDRGSEQADDHPAKKP
jgi:hypothetical protein